MAAVTSDTETKINIDEDENIKLEIDGTFENTDTEADAEVQAEDEVEADTEVETEVEDKTEDEADAEVEADTEAETENDAENEVEDKTESEAEAEIEEPIIQQNKKKKNKKVGAVDIFHNSMITKKISVPIHNVGKNIRETLEKIIANEIEGKCIAEGYVKENSTRIMTYSCGVVNSNNVVFDVAFECSVCLPVEGMHIICVAKNITKAGIRAETEDSPSPVVIFVARDHNATNNKFAKVTTGRKIKIRVIGQRYELNDKYISIIAELIDSNIGETQTTKKVKKLTFKKK